VALEPTILLTLRCSARPMGWAMASCTAAAPGRPIKKRQLPGLAVAVLIIALSLFTPIDEVAAHAALLAHMFRLVFPHHLAVPCRSCLPDWLFSRFFEQPVTRAVLAALTRQCGLAHL